MKYTIKITNPDLFGETEVDLSGLKFRDGSGALHGDVEINGKTITGEHGERDYEADYGFIIVTAGRGMNKR